MSYFQEHKMLNKCTHLYFCQYKDYLINLYDFKYNQFPLFHFHIWNIIETKWSWEFIYWNMYNHHQHHHHRKEIFYSDDWIIFNKCVWVRACSWVMCQYTYVRFRNSLCSVLVIHYRPSFIPWPFPIRNREYQMVWKRFSEVEICRMLDLWASYPHTNHSHYREWNMFSLATLTWHLMWRLEIS